MVFVLNITLVSGEVYVDKTPPHSYIESMSGWNDNGVTLKLKAQDELSGISAVSYMIDGSLLNVSYSPEIYVHFGTEGVHRIEYFAMDGAGNAEQAKISQVKLDFTMPVITIEVPASRTYLHSDIIILNFSADDSLSGILSLTASINGTPVTPSQEFDMQRLRPGVHEFRAVALDNAGNPGWSTQSFTVVTNIYSLMALNNRAIINGWISDRETADSLTRKLDLAGQKLEEGQNEKANNIIKSYINEIDAKRGNAITGYGADILMTEALYVYISLF